MGGGGIRNENEGMVTLGNSIVAGNSGFGPDCNGIIESSGYNIIGNTIDCSFEQGVGDLVNIDPNLTFLQDNGGFTLTHALSQGSPAIDSGNPAIPESELGACPSTDQRGAERPLDGDGSGGSRCDIGAFELDPTSSTAPFLEQEMKFYPDENAVLEALYLSTDGDNWKEASGWLSEQSVCSWFGVTCVAGSVSKLELAENRLNGPFPENLSGLSNIITLDLHGNGLSGQIPAGLGDLQNLVRLDLSFNKLNGNIPPELGKLKNLIHLVLNGNHMLSGPIPPELGNLSSLNDLMLSSYEGGTQLSGTIPVELSNLTKLTHLEISNSLVIGPIPPELGNLTNLIYLDLSHSPLSGALPAEIGNLTNLQIFHVGGGRNSLYGSLPSNMMNWKKMRSLQFNGTDICEPSDPAFQAWLDSIPELYRTRILCPSDP